MSKDDKAGFDLEELFTDQKKEVDGVWVDFYGGAKLKLASMQSPVYKAALAKQAKLNKLRLDDDNDDVVELVNELTCKAMADHVLIDWKGINLPEEKDAKYTPEKGETALLRSAKFREFVAEAADDHNNFKATADAVKKS